MLVPLGEYSPDQPMTELVRAENCYALPEGYTSVPSFAALTAALPAAFKGGGAFVSPTGVATLLAGTATNLYKYNGTSWTSVIASTGSVPWSFTQFGNNVICANGTQLISFSLSAGTAAAISGAPTATDVATVRDFVFALKPAGDRLNVQWSGFNDSAGWTIGVNQSDDQPLLSGGEAMRVIGGEYGLVLQKNAIQRFDYEGGDIIFRRSEISSEIGCMAAGSVQKVGNLVFFLSERGFMMIDGSGQVTPIGEEKINRTFFAQFSRDDIASKITVAADPRRPHVLWCMPGNPGSVYVFNYVLNRWTVLSFAVSAVFTGFTSSLGLETIAASYPSGLESIPYSFDDPRFSGGSPILIAVNNSNTLGTLTGSHLPAVFGLQWQTPAGDVRSRVINMRLVGDALATGEIDARLNMSDAENTVYASARRSNGKMPIRCNGRYLKPTVSTSGQWTVAKAVEMEIEPGAAR